LNLFLNDSTEILVQDSATLNINGYYTKFIGCTGQCFVNIEGDISSTYMNFEADTGATININFNNISKNYTLTAFNFKNASIQASCHTLKFSLTDFENSPLEFSGGRLELSQSNLLSGSDLEFSGAYLKITNNNVIDNSGLFLYSGTDTINESNDIINTEIEFSGDELYIFGPNNISHSTLDLSNGNINIEDGNNFVNSSLAINDPLDDASFIDISDNSFDNDSIIDANAVVTIENYQNFLVDDNDFSYASGRGIELFYAGWDGRGTQSLEDNTVHFTGTAYPQVAELGIHSYYSNVQISNNQITDNDYGIAGFHGSDLRVNGNSQATGNDSTQLIADNTISQCIFNYSSFPSEFEYNVIRDYTSGTNPFIKAVEYDEMIIDTNENREIRGIPDFVVENNCWVDHSDPSGRLIPLGYYDWDPVWCPGESMMKSDDVAETMFYAAKAEIGAENYLAADSGFKQIIVGFPDNRFALASLKELFALNPALYDSNFAILKAYCDNLTLNPGDSLLGKTAEWISIHCNIRDQHYQPAINSLDSIIFNPGTQADSVFALIDLGYVFLLNSENPGSKSVLVTKHPEIIPESNNHYKIMRKAWIDILLQPKGGSSLGENEMMQPPDESQSCRITSIRPNPSAGDFTIDIEVSKAGPVRVIIVSPTRAVVSELKFIAENPGKYQQTISEPALKPGVYFLLVSVAQDKPDFKKLVVIE
jgi:hypothetical protein